MLKFMFFVIMLSGLIFLSSCDEESVITPGSGTLTLNINGLTDLGSSANYEGWVIVSGAPISTGTFQVDANGNLSRNTFSVTSATLSSASAFILTIEPNPDQSPSPSQSKLLAGDFAGNSASLTINHAEALKTDFANTTGNFILATPTDGGNNTNELSGVWFLRLPQPPQPGLSLPLLPAGWKYEGWAVINNIPVTTGKFTSIATPDESAPFSGPVPGPNFPGEDFLNNAPSGLSFPTNLQGQRIVITVEPEPDNSTMPFGTLRPLIGDVPQNAVDHQNYNMFNQQSLNPAGTATR